MEQVCPLKQILWENEKDNEQSLTDKNKQQRILVEDTDEEKLDCEACVETFVIVAGKFSIYSDEHDKNIIDNDLKTFYENKIVLDEAEVTDLYINTRKQSKSPRWAPERIINNLKFRSLKLSISYFLCTQ